MKTPTVFLGVLDEVVGLLDVVLQLAVVPIQAHQVLVHVFEPSQNLERRAVSVTRLLLRGLELSCCV